MNALYLVLPLFGAFFRRLLACCAETCFTAVVFLFLSALAVQVHRQGRRLAKQTTLIQDLLIASSARASSEKIEILSRASAVDDDPFRSQPPSRRVSIEAKELPPAPKPRSISKLAHPKGVSMKPRLSDGKSSLDAAFQSSKTLHLVIASDEEASDQSHEMTSTDAFKTPHRPPAIVPALTDRRSVAFPVFYSEERSKDKTGFVARHLTYSPPVTPTSSTLLSPIALHSPLSSSFSTDASSCSSSNASSFSSSFSAFLRYESSISDVSNIC
jgi:hypothetical protein